MYWEISECNQSCWDFNLNFDRRSWWGYQSRWFFFWQRKVCAEKEPVVAKGEAAKASKTDTKLKKIKCDQCNYTKSSQKRLTQHVWIKHCFSLDVRCFRQDHAYLCCDVIVVRFINQNPERQGNVGKMLKDLFTISFIFLAI